MSKIITGDAQANLGFLLSQTTHIETQVNETKYAAIQYKNLIPVDTSASEFAKSVTYFSNDKFGSADWVNGNSDDVPMAGTEKSKFETQIFMAGIGYGYGFEELEHARMLGQNLQADDAVAARRAYEEMVERVAFKGDVAKGFQGLLNNSNVAVASATNGDWTNAATTEDQILQDINDALINQAASTNFVGYADTLLLSYERLNLLATTRLGDTSMTILQFVKENNTYTAMTGQALTIRALRDLSTAGAGNAQRMITYRRNPEVLRMHIPMPHRFLPVFQKSSTYFEVPGVFRLGGVDIRYPNEVRYTDGI